jgi:hypothetical protein
MVSSFFSMIARWFGYVGSCVAGSESTCLPFLAFLALALVSAGALAMVLHAYRALQPEDERREAAARQALAREREMQERIRRKIAARVSPRQAVHRGWRIPA